MAKVSKDLSVGTLHPRETLFIVGNLGALNAEVIVPTDGCSSIAIDLRGTFSMTIEVSGTVDGTNWTLICVRPINQATKQYVAAITGTAAGVWAASCPAYRQVRARVTAYTSGLAVTSLSASTAPLDNSAEGLVTAIIGTTTAAIGVAATLTLGAPGAGLRQYITYLSINRFAGAVLTPAATPVLVTTTNLPGTLVFSIPIEAAAQGTIDRYREDFAYPLAASAQNSSVTIVAPIVTGVIWRLTAGYYVAP
jgi:hypothetical protein